MNTIEASENKRLPHLFPSVKEGAIGSFKAIKLWLFERIRFDLRKVSDIFELFLRQFALVFGFNSESNPASLDVKI